MAEISWFKFWLFLFSAKGRIGRATFAVATIPLWIVMSVWQRGLVVTANHSIMTHGIILPDWWFVIILFSIGFDLFCLCAITALASKRLHDVGYSGKWALLVPIQFIVAMSLPLLSPLVGAATGMSSEAAWQSIVMFLRPVIYLKYFLWAATVILCFVPGTHAFNRYGEAPQKSDLPLA